MIVRVLLLIGTVLALTTGHRHVRPALAVAAGVGAALVTGAVQVGQAATDTRPLMAPLAFLAFAVPLALQLDGLGFFEAAASRVVAGHRIRPALWLFAAAVTTLFNLDAAIVLLTPLYVRIARRFGLDPVATAFQPVLLASLASSALPVSNLTNLIVANRDGLRVGSFLLHLGPASLVAVAAGWWLFRRIELTGRPPLVVDGNATGDADRRRALRLGIPAVIALLVGFTLGDGAGIPPWAVAALVSVFLTAVTRRFPWRRLPIDAMVVAAGLAVLA